MYPGYGKYTQVTGNSNAKLVVVGYFFFQINYISIYVNILFNGFYIIETPTQKRKLRQVLFKEKFVLHSVARCTTSTFGGYKTRVSQKNSGTCLYIFRTRVHLSILKSTRGTFK